MDSGIVRDFVISICGGLILFLMVIAIIIGFLLYREVRRLNSSIKLTINTGKEMSSELKQAAKNSKELFSLFKGTDGKSETRSTSDSRV